MSLRPSWMKVFPLNLYKLKGCIYDASLSIQPDSAKAAVTNMASIIPGGLMLLCALVVCFYPISRNRFRAMQNARKLRDEGKAYSTSEFDSIL